MSKIKLVIFDFDGVLRHVSWFGLRLAYMAIIASQNKDYREFFDSIEDFKKWYSVDYHDNLKRIGIPESNYSSMQKPFHLHYDSYTYLYPWVENTLKELRTKNKSIVLTILSSSTTPSIKASLSEGNLKRYFNLIVGSDMVKKIKPNPEGVYYILKKFPHIHKEEAIIIGDTKLDLKAGKNIKKGFVTWGIENQDEVIKLMPEDLPDYIFENPQDLTKIVE